MAFLSDLFQKLIALSIWVDFYINPSAFLKSVSYRCFSMWSRRNVHTTRCLRLSRTLTFLSPTSLLQNRKTFTKLTAWKYMRLVTNAEPITAVCSTLKDYLWGMTMVASICRCFFIAEIKMEFQVVLILEFLFIHKLKGNSTSSSKR